jgi:hypothetical protein
MVLRVQLTEPTKTATSDVNSNVMLLDFSRSGQAKKIYQVQKSNFS